jgi:hypothetical protein
VYLGCFAINDTVDLTLTSANLILTRFNADQLVVTTIPIPFDSQLNFTTGERTNFCAGVDMRLAQQAGAVPDEFTSNFAIVLSFSGRIVNPFGVLLAVIVTDNGDVPFLTNGLDYYDPFPYYSDLSVPLYQSSTLLEMARTQSYQLTNAPMFTLWLKGQCVTQERIAHDQVSSWQSLQPGQQGNWVLQFRYSRTPGTPYFSMTVLEESAEFTTLQLMGFVGGFKAFLFMVVGWILPKLSVGPARVRVRRATTASDSSLHRSLTSTRIEDYGMSGRFSPRPTEPILCDDRNSAEQQV